MKRFLGRSIRHKMITIITGTCLVVLTMASAVWFINDWFSFRQSAQKNLNTLAGVLGDNLSAAINFQVQEDAEKTLRALRAMPEILQAAALDAQGKPFAVYARTPEDGLTAIPAVEPDGAKFTSTGLTLFKRLYFEDEQIGTIFLRSSTVDFYQRILFALLMSGAVLIASLLVAAVISTKLQAVITRPVLTLLSAVEKVSEEKIFNVRVEKTTDDEIGLLVDGFNNMLTQIEVRDNELARHRESLEEEVSKRTAELQETNSALTASEKKIRSIVDTAADAIILFDENGCIVSFNRAATKVFGYEPDEIVGKRFVSLTASQKTSRPYMGLTEHLMLRALEAPVIGREFLGLSKSGKVFPMELSLTAVDMGDKRQFSCILRDITERKAALDQLIKAKEEAEALARTKSQFLANMSHEIRTPMNGIFGALQLVLKTQLNGDQRELLELMKGSADSLLRIINDVLDFSKIDAGKLTLANSEFSLRESATRVLGVIFLRATQQELKFDMEIDDQVPDKLIGDSQRLGQVLINLVGNAVKFTPKGGSVLLKIWNEERANGRVILHVMVKDTGIGIPEDKQQEIFEAFSQADTSSTREFGGTGLGLAISSNLVKLMGGKLWVKSKIGEGSEFHFCVKLEEVLREEQLIPAKAEAKRDLIRADGKVATLDILLVEDNLVNQKIGQAFLHSLGHKVTIANNGKEAVDKLEQTRFDLVFMDCQMPVMDGFTAVAAIREKERGHAGRLPIIAMTAHAMAGDRERCLENGMDDYISKPIEEKELEAVILRTLTANKERSKQAT